MGVYQLVGKKVVTLLVSDGLCAFQGENRDTLTNHFDERMFERVHPDDVQMLVNMAYRFAIQKGKYDVIYRSCLYGKAEYRHVHAVSKYHTMEDGSQVAFTNYADVTEAMHSIVENTRQAEAPLARFLNENVTAMVIVSRAEKILFYYNKAIIRLLQPQLPFDSNMTFDEFFYPDLSTGIVGLFDTVDMGPHVVVEPRTGRRLEANVMSTMWNESPAYAVYFYAYTAGDDQSNPEDDLRKQRMAFNHVMFAGESNDLPFWQDGAKLFSVWNLTQDRLVMKSGNGWLAQMKDGMTIPYDVYHGRIMDCIHDAEEREAMRKCSRQELMLLYEAGGRSNQVTCRTDSEHGYIAARIGFTLMCSSDDGELYLKVMSENISQRAITDLLFKKVLEEEQDYVAYFDGKADICRIVFGRVVSQDQKDRTITIEDYLQNFPEHGMGFPEDTEAFIRYIAGLCNGGMTHSQVYTLPNGALKRMQIQLLDAGTNRFLLRRMDVTELLREERQKAEQIEQLKDAAQAANREKSLFMARMSHDLRTPMGAILSLARFGINECPDESCKTYFEQIHDSGEYMLNMLNEILDMQKLESGQVDLHYELIQLGGIERKVRTILQPRMQEKKQLLEVHQLLPPGQYVFSDVHRVEQILVNILMNAVKYTPAGGTICWTSRAEYLSDKIFVIHEIQDNGVGMSEEFQQRMFQPFSREANQLSQKEGGAGLGLSIVKKLVDAMQGTITVESNLGQGTLFRIRMPYALPTEQDLARKAVSEAVEPTVFDFTGRRLLVCEDNELNRMIVQKILESVGFMVELAVDGAEGVRKARAGGYDAILMDIRMPVMDGLEAAREIRKFDAEISIIALSANVTEEDIAQSLAAGMNAHQMKPIDPPKLFHTLQSLLK
jgi:signal transduction histidine kinase